MTHDTYAQKAIHLRLKPSQTVLEALREAGVEFSAPCGGTGRCGKCKVVAEGENLSPLGREEIELLSSREISDGVRLACMAKGEGSCQVRTLENDPLAASGWDVRPEPSRPGDASNTAAGGALGVAVDLGTTKVHARLLAKDGTRLASAVELNSQAIFGSDIMNRMKAATSSRSAELKDRIRRQIDWMIRAMCRKAGVDGSAVSDLCIVGNTAMIHLLMGWPVEQLAFAPYQPFTLDSHTLSADELELDACPGAWVHLPPAIGGFVGSDHLAMLLASGLDKAGDITLGIDIGTNTEINLNIPETNRSISISCPSGPAFEGGEISCGMLAVRGAIVDLAPGPGGFYPQTIDNAPPTGICGSGMIRAVDICTRLGIIDKRGRIKDAGLFTEASGGKRRIRLNTGCEPALFLTQEDVDAILLAKAAIAAGIKLILEREGLDVSRVGKVVLAGSFGSHLDLGSAINIGMLPDLPVERFEKAGNAAAEGAGMMLFSPAERERAEVLAERIEHLELQGAKEFRKLFAKAFYLPHVNQ